jgi:hypothetical protein
VSDSIALNVPTTLEALYIVPLRAPLADVDGAIAAAAKALESPVAEETAALLGADAIAVAQNAASDFPPLPVDVLRMFGASDDVADAIGAATHLLAVEAAYAPGWPPSGDWVARGLAAQIAVEQGSIVVDMGTPRALAADAALATLPDAQGAIALTKWVLIPRSAGDTGLWFATTGLNRFGLPELQTTDVPEALEHLWGEVLSGIASRLLAEWAAKLREAPGATTVEIPSALTVTTIDLAQAFGEKTVRDHAEAHVLLRIDAPAQPGGDVLITVLPPADETRSTSDFYTAVCDTLLGAADA